MSFIASVSKVITAINELKALKVALGFDESASVVDIIKQLKAAAAQIDSASTATTGKEAAQ